MITSGIARIAQDPKIVTVGNTQKVELVLVTTEKRKGREKNNVTDSHFLNFEAWDAAAKFIYDVALKGDTIYVEATPRQEKWEKDGKKMSRQYFRINNFKIFPKLDQQEE